MSSCLLSGNEAVARGAWEAGVRLGAGYPGTPSTEILESLARYDGVYCEWSTNEKVALEVAVGASLAGARAIATMKHVGLNVAADPLFSAAYMGVNGGLVVVSADDPGMHSSQNEQDNRLFAAAARIPLLEPATPDECRAFTRRAFELSERFDTPVLLRTTTRLSHGRAAVELQGPEQVELIDYTKNRVKNVVLPAHARIRHRLIEDVRMPRLAEEAESWIERFDADGDVAFIAAGIPYLYVREAFPEAAVLKLGMTYPLPERAIRDFARGRRVLVVEELEPFLEQQIRALGIETAPRTWPRYGELSTGALRAACAPVESRARPAHALPVRPPALCAGCSHRATFHALRRLGAIVTGDIGCYTLGALPPLDAIDSCMNMGASIGMGHGFEKVTTGKARPPLVAVIGDSTFFHSGITGLLDVVYNGGNSTVVVLDNRTTAMTGHQGHPGTGQRLAGGNAPAIEIEAVVRALGVQDVRLLDSYDLDATCQTIADAVTTSEPSVLIARAPCVLKERVSFGSPVELNHDQCTDCHACVQLGCPALELHGLELSIDPLRCVGCSHCQQVCADCNTGLDAGRVLELLERDEVAEAVDVVLRTNPLPATVARICPHPCDHAINALGWPQAERRAQRYPRLLARFGNADGTAISMRAVEQWLGDYALANPHAAAPVAERGVSIAIVGSGPAGLSAAWQLRQRGCQVTVIEADAQPGGMLRHGIPEFRLPRAVLDAELARLRDAGIQFRTSTRVNDPSDFERLRAQHDAVVLAVGDSRARELRIMGGDGVAPERVITGLDFLKRFNAGQRVAVGDSVAIVGGGNTAVDCARAAVRLGARAVVVYRRTEREMPAIPEEVAEARREGVVFDFERMPVRMIVGAHGELIALEMRQTRQDAGRVLEIAGTEHSASFDTVITAVGEEADVAFLNGAGVHTNGGITTGFAGTTSAPGVFACGDAAFGYGTVGQAIASGRKTAMAMIAMMGW